MINEELTPEDAIAVTHAVAEGFAEADVISSSEIDQMGSLMAALALCIQDIVNDDNNCVHCKTIRSVAANVPV